MTDAEMKSRKMLLDILWNTLGMVGKSSSSTANQRQDSTHWESRSAVFWVGTETSPHRVKVEVEIEEMFEMILEIRFLESKRPEMSFDGLRLCSSTPMEWSEKEVKWLKLLLTDSTTKAPIPDEAFSCPC